MNEWIIRQWFSCYGEMKAYDGLIGFDMAIAVVDKNGNAKPFQFQLNFKEI